MCATFILLVLVVYVPPAYPAPPKGCSSSYSRADFHRTARKAFRAFPYTTHERVTLRRVIRCQVHAKSVKIVKYHFHRYLRAYEHRRLIARLGPNRALAYRLLRNPRQWPCLDALWWRESKWRTGAHNPSGAHGIPQALPGSKMGPGWQSSPYVQIRWGLGYIRGRYGTPCAADGFQRSHNWY